MAHHGDLRSSQKTSRIPPLKTTFDLPPDIVRAVKLRVVHEGRKLKDVAADLLKRGLASPETPLKPKLAKPRIEMQSNGLPVIRCAADAPAKRMSATELLALEQENLHQDAFSLAGFKIFALS